MKRLLVCLLLVGVVGCGESEQVDPNQEANRLFVAAVKLIGFAEAQPLSLDDAVKDYEQALKNIHSIIDDYSESDLAVKLIAGEALFTGRTLADIKVSLAELRGLAAATFPGAGGNRSDQIDDPSLGMVNPTQFMNDLTSTIGEFGDLLDSFDDEQSVIDAEEEMAALITRMETVSNQSMRMTEPPAEEREKLMEKLSELEDLVRRLVMIQERQQLNGEVWKAVKDNFGRFEGAMRMCEMIPPAGL